MGKRIITDGAGQELAAQLGNIKAQLNGEDTANVSPSNYNSKDFLSEDTGRDIATKVAAIVTALKNSKSNSNGTGTCSTAASTAAKVVSLTDNSGWKLVAGSTVTVKFTYTNTANNPTINVNGTGAKRIWYGTALITSSELNKAGYANRYITYVYDGTQYVFVGWSYDTDTNTTYTNADMGNGYGTCSTAASTTVKAVTLIGYSLSTGGTVSVKFTYAVPANATMNINSRGAKPIYYQGAAITAGIIKAGDIATFVYNGSQYILLAIDRVCKDGANGADGADGAEGLSTYRSTASTSTSTTSVALSTITIPEGRTVKVGDLIIANSTYSYMYRVTAVSGTDATVDYLCSLRGAVGNAGRKGSGFYYSSQEALTTYRWLEGNQIDTHVSNNEFIITKNLLLFKVISYDGTRYEVDYIGTLKGADGATGADGPAGPAGATGADGNGISSAVVTYAASTSGTEAPTSWSDSIPSVAAGSYLWTKTVTAYTNGTSTTAYSVARQGVDGSAVAKGDDGNGIASVIVKYAHSTSGTVIPTSWVTSIPSVMAGSYFWTKTVTTYTDGTSTTAYSIARQGADGAKGEKGETGTAGKTLYKHMLQFNSNTCYFTSYVKDSIPSLQIFRAMCLQGAIFGLSYSNDNINSYISNVPIEWCPDYFIIYTFKNGSLVKNQINYTVNFTDSVMEV